MAECTQPPKKLACLAVAGESKRLSGRVRSLRDCQSAPQAPSWVQSPRTEEDSLGIVAAAKTPISCEWSPMEKQVWTPLGATPATAATMTPSASASAASSKAARSKWPPSSLGGSPFDVEERDEEEGEEEVEPMSPVRPCAAAGEDSPWSELPQKNTFIHFSTPNERPKAWKMSETVPWGLKFADDSFFTEQFMMQTPSPVLSSAIAVAGMFAGEATASLEPFGNAGLLPAGEELPPMFGGLPAGWALPCGVAAAVPCHQHLNFSNGQQQDQHPQEQHPQEQQPPQCLPHSTQQCQGHGPLHGGQQQCTCHPHQQQQERQQPPCDGAELVAGLPAWACAAVASAKASALSSRVAELSKHQPPDMMPAWPQQVPQQLPAWPQPPSTSNAAPILRLSEHLGPAPQQEKSLNGKPLSLFELLHLGNRPFELEPTRLF
eukprot:NODE_2530_length_2195_cov_12.438104.p1 GENE.NODE_2530_length_2195_cov_12.438104~~NODE_2530_length_2195_cov_12.438104.p1  ORF type:complete len:434 (+),score=94.76 NODE_2530_length_2195_cov_12.438104:114-1415(+)